MRLKEEIKTSVERRQQEHLKKKILFKQKRCRRHLFKISFLETSERPDCDLGSWLGALLWAKAADHSDLCGPAQTQLLQTRIHIDPSAGRQYTCAHL